MATMSTGRNETDGALQRETLEGPTAFLQWLPVSTVEASVHVQ